MHEYSPNEQIPHQTSTNDAQPQGWSSLALFSFRYAFCYLVLYLLYLLDELFFIMIYFPTRKEPPGLISPLWHVIIPWFGRHVLHLHTDITIFTNSSADTTHDFVLVLFHLIVAALATAVWSALDRNRKEYRVLHQWLRLGVQFFLSAMVLAYGVDKLIPLQFRNLTLLQMVRPVGEMSPITLLWTFMAASPLYTIFAGSAEVLGGVLVLFRRTVTLGALICFAAMCNVLALNVGYDVPVKLQTFQFALLGLFLLAPDFQRLASFFLYNRPAEPRCEVPLSNRAQVDRVARHAVPFLGILVLGLVPFLPVVRAAPGCVGSARHVVWRLGCGSIHNRGNKTRAAVHCTAPKDDAHPTRARRMATPAI